MSQDSENQAKGKAREIADREDRAGQAPTGVIGTGNGTGAGGGTGTAAISGNLGKEKGSEQGPTGQDVGLEPDSE